VPTLHPFVQQKPLPVIPQIPLMQSSSSVQEEPAFAIPTHWWALQT
jgi:hypothetical protein